MKIPENAQEILQERFGHDCLIALATVDGGTPCVRCIRLTHGVLYSRGVRYDLDFTAREGVSPC